MAEKVIHQNGKSRLHRNTMTDYVLIVICALIAFVTVYPMWYVICCALSEPIEVLRGNITFRPIGFTTDSLALVARNQEMWHAMMMSVFYASVATVGMLICCMLMAYPLTRPNLKCRRLVVIFLVLPMYFSGGLTPTFIIMTKVLKLYNTVWAVVLPSFISIFNIILCRTFLASLPQELNEAAFIDGAGNWQVLWRIVLPLAKPVLAVISIYTIVGNWNAWWNSMLYQTKTYMHPLQMYLQRLIIQQSVNIMELAEAGADADELRNAAQQALSARQIKFSFIVFVTVPILMIYPMFQKHFVKGVMLGSPKG